MPRNLKTVGFLKYATSGCHHFDRDPNLDIAILKGKITVAETPDKKRQVITDYLENGFKQEEISPVV